MEPIAKYILYYNVNTHDLYDASGAFMGSTPFSVYFDNLISVELHYMEDTSSDSISEWIPWTALEGNTVGSSICFDDDYIHAKTGKIYADASVGDTSLIVHVSLDSEVVNPTGVLVVYKNDESISIPYTGYIENDGIYTFNLQNPLQIQLNQGDQVRVPQALLLKVDSDDVDHSRSSVGIFSFNTRVLSHKLMNKLIYGNSSSVSGTFEHQIVSDGNIVFTVTFDMKVNSLLNYDGQADIPKSGNWADKAYVDSKIITKTSELQNDAGFISEEVDPVYNADKPNIALKSELFSKRFADLIDLPDTLAGYGINDVKIDGNTITISDKSITIEPPEPLTKTAVDEVIGVRSSGSAKKFYNEQGQFVSVDGVRSVNGVPPDVNGDVFIDVGDLISQERFLDSIGAVLKVNGVLPEEGEVTLGLNDFTIKLQDESQEFFGDFIIDFYDKFIHLDAHGVQFTNSQYNTVGGALSGLIYRVEQLEGGSGGGSGGGTVVSVDGISPDGNGDVQLTYPVMVSNYYVTDSLVNWLNNFSYRIQQLESNQGSGGSSFSGSFNELTDLPTTLNGYGITDAYISGRTITLGSNSITIPESGGGGGDYTLTKEAVDSVIGASSTGSTVKFYNEQGAFTTVTGFLPLGGGTIDGDLWLNGTLYTDQSLLVSFRDTFTLGCYDTGGLPIEPDTVSELVLDKPNATARVKLLYTKSESDINEAGLYLDAKSSMSDPSELYVPGFMKIWTGNDTVTVNQIFLRGALGILIKSNTAINIESGTGYFRFNSKDVAVVDDITAHNEDATAHTDLFALKEDTGVAQGLVDTHNESDTAHEALFEAKADKTELNNYLPLSGGTMTGQIEFNTAFDIRNTSGDNTRTTYIRSSSNANDGAYLALCGKDVANSGGSFVLVAANGTNTIYFTGYPDGKLTWNGNYVTALPGGYSGGTIYVGANRDIKTISDAIAYINRYSSGSNKKWTLKLDAGEYAIGLSVYGLWLSIEPASGSYSTACRLTGQISTDHHAVLEFINMHFGGTTNGTVNAGIYGKTSLIKCTNCTFYAGTSLSTSIQGDYGAIFYLSGCKFYSPTTSFTGSWFQSIRVGGSCFVGIAGTTTFTGGGYSNSYAMVVFAGSYISSNGSVTISNYKYGVNASQSGNAYVGSTITFNNVTTKFTPAQGAVGNGNSYIN